MSLYKRWVRRSSLPRTAPCYGDTFQTSTNRQPLPTFATTPPMSQPRLAELRHLLREPAPGR